MEKPIRDIQSPLQNPPSQFVTVRGHRLEYQDYLEHQVHRPTLVFLHEGLGSVSMWRDFPARVAAATGCRTVVYSRYGYGESDVLEEPFPFSYMHDEALLSLPELLEKLNISRPVVIGHSDGASIALIHAGAGRWDVSGVVVLAPHVFTEDKSVESIAKAKTAYQTTELRERLARYHRDPEKTFFGWNDVWLLPEFRNWNIEEYLDGIRCPVLAIQGADDEYGTMVHVQRIAQRVRDADVLELADCRHSPHRDQPEATLDAMVRFISRIK